MDGLRDELNDRLRRGLYRVRRRLQSAQGPHVRYQARDYINFSSNDYLNYASDPRLARAAARAARRYGCGAGASPLVSGHLPPLRALERAIAAWQGTEAAIVFSSGYAANLAVLSALTGPEGAIFSDELNHASLIDGCRLSRATIHIYRHRDVDHIEELLRKQTSRARRRVIATDTVFSMDGDLAPLEGLLALAEHYDCHLVVDEAHATGVLGERGTGMIGTLSVDAKRGDRIVHVGTLSKALGAQGGFVCGSKLLVDWLVNVARPYIFSTALAPPLAAAARQAVALVQAEPERRRQLLHLGALLRDNLNEAGFDVGGSACQIVPVIVGPARDALLLSRRLEERGLLVPAIRPPSVAEGTARLRISVSAGHTGQEIIQLVATLKECR
jgi:8-amino-7-oxononanoate synthase